MVRVFLFFLGTRPRKCEPKDSSRAASTAQSLMNQTKVTVHPYKSFGQAFSKACGNPKGKARGRSRRSETPLRILTNKAKVTVKPSKRNKSKKRNVAKKVGTTDVTLVTILTDPIICIALILTYKAKVTLFQICERSRANLENKANYRRVKFRNKANP